MKSYIEKLKAQIEADPIPFYDDGDTPALEALYFHYTECHCMHSDLTKQISAELNDLTNGLTFIDADKICSLSSELAAEHERIAFIAGLQLGAQLVLELSEEQETAPSWLKGRCCLRQAYSLFIAVQFVKGFQLFTCIISCRFPVVHLTVWQ